jgi:hypothetical protein
MRARRARNPLHATSRLDVDSLRAPSPPSACALHAPVLGSVFAPLFPTHDRACAVLVRIYTSRGLGQTKSLTGRDGNRAELKRSGAAFFELLQKRRYAGRIERNRLRLRPNPIRSEKGATTKDRDAPSRHPIRLSDAWIPITLHVCRWRIGGAEPTRPPPDRQMHRRRG